MNKLRSYNGFLNQKIIKISPLGAKALGEIFYGKISPLGAKALGEIFMGKYLPSGLKPSGRYFKG